MQFRHQLAAIFLAVSALPAFSQEVAEPLEIQPVVLESTNLPEVTPPVLEPPKNFPQFLTSRQIELLEQALAIGKEDNHKNPELLQGILMQETTAGAANYKTARNRCFGIFQLKIAAAKDVLKAFPELVLQFGVNPKNDKVIKERLIHDDVFNTTVASKYLILLKGYGYDTIKELALAYNQGAGGAKKKNPNTHVYSTGVIKQLKKLGIH